MKVYVIEAGVYSDRRIVAVTLNKNDAYRLRDAAEEDDYYDAASINEFDTDDYKIIDDERKLYHVFVSDSRTIVYPKGKRFDLLGKEYHTCWPKVGTHDFDIRANSEEEAKKIAYDLIAECKAREEGIA